MACRAPNFTEQDLQQWKLIADFRARLVPLLEADRAARVSSDAWPRLGCKKRYRTDRLRVVTIQSATAGTCDWWLV